MKLRRGLEGFEPIFACLFIFKTLAHSTTAAPELSMQLSIVYIVRVSTIKVMRVKQCG